MKAETKTESFIFHLLFLHADLGVQAAHPFQEVPVGEISTFITITIRSEVKYCRYTISSVHGIKVQDANDSFVTTSLRQKSLS